MFEFLMITSIVLIVFSQQLPEYKQTSKVPPAKEKSGKVKESNQIRPVPKSTHHKPKQPCRNIFNRAA